LTALLLSAQVRFHRTASVRGKTLAILRGKRSQAFVLVEFDPNGLPF
jgi:hypothetical protein